MATKVSGPGVCSRCRGSTGSNAFPFTGERCEVLRSVCQTNRQCQNGGICVEGVCVCPPAYTGQTCGEGQSLSLTRVTHTSVYSPRGDSGPVVPIALPLNSDLLVPTFVPVS